MSVNAILNIPTQRQGLVVPRDAAIRQPDGRVVVWTVEPSPEQGESTLIAIENTVKTGETFADQIEITHGLTLDSRIIVRGNETLRNRQTIRISDGTQSGDH